MELEDLTGSSGEWLRGSGPESDIVISSRIRLARNLADFPFIRTATDHDRLAIERTICERALTDDHLKKTVLYLNVSELEVVDRQFLVERQLNSRQHAESEGARGVAIGSRET